MGTSDAPCYQQQRCESLSSLSLSLSLLLFSLLLILSQVGLFDVASNAGLLLTNNGTVAPSLPLNTLMKQISIFWIIPQYFLVSCAEILLSVTAYEFAVR